MAEKIKTASLGIAEEAREMKKGETKAFPLDKYKYDSVRHALCAGLVPERIEGKQWSSRLDIPNKCVYVTRVS